eukprot:761993-Pelagomonas_calceolata.AAC.1
MPLWHLPNPILRNGWTCTTSFWLSAQSALYGVMLLLHQQGGKQSGAKEKGSGPRRLPTIGATAGGAQGLMISCCLRLMCWSRQKSALELGRC